MKMTGEFSLNSCASLVRSNPTTSFHAATAPQYCRFLCASLDTHQIASQTYLRRQHTQKPFASTLPGIS